MSNRGRKKLYTQLFNEEFKLWFLEEIKKNKSINTYTSYLNLFRKIGEYELKVYQKDIYDFTLDEIKDLVKAFRCDTINSVTNCLTKISQYIEFSKSHGQGISNIPMSIFLNKDIAKELVNPIAEKHRYITREELYTLINRELTNAQDAAIFVLLLDGVRGKNFEEIVNLKNTDIDFKNRNIELSNRILTNIDPRSLEILEDAINQHIYLNGNGESLSKNSQYELGDSDFVLRQRKGGKNESIPFTGQIIEQRIKKLREILGKGYLNPTSIFYSGVFERLLKEEKVLARELSFSEIEGILKKEYGIHKSTANVKDGFKAYKLYIEETINK